MKKYFIFTCCILTFFSCSKPSDSNLIATTAFSCNSSPLAKGARKFGMDISDVPIGGTYADNLNSLISMGGSFQTLHLYWSQIEGTGSGLTSGAFTDPYGGSLAALNAIALAQNIKVTLRIHPVDIPGKFIPSDLMSTRFNTMTMKTRAKAMLAFVFTKISPSNVHQIYMGNEMDGYDPGSDVNFWLDYPDFLSDLKSNITTNYNLNLGFVTTLNGVTNSSLTLPPAGAWNSVAVFSAWMSAVNIIGITYYPLSPSLQMKANSGVATDFQKLVAFTNKPIHIEEIGYASSPANLGSENLQAEFFCEVFKAWDTYQTQVPSMSILRMNNFTRANAEATATAYGLTGNENFIEYIRSLGLKSETGVVKTAFTSVSEELKKRGF